ncbi:MAG: hypothetical protein HDR19_03705 [Lachnospiraceae bacterium]|nr:hypothetical protein [Lachnospiraceae bacterium]
MTDSRTGRKAGRVCVLTVFTILLVAFPAIVFDFYYDLNDDTLIKDIVSGAYTGAPSGYCVQLLYPLAWLIALLYKVVPSVAWYGLFLCVCQFGVVILIAMRLTAIFKTTKGRIMALLAAFFLFYGLFLREFVIVQYSVTSGMCMMCAIFLFITSDDKKGNNAIPLVLVALAFMIRTEVCLMLMPFVLYAGMFKWASEEKIFTVENVRKYLLLIGFALLGMFAVFSLDLLAYHGNEWSNFRDFFDARTKLYDFYGIPDYEQNIDFYESVGLSRESYTLLENYNFALDDSIDTWLLESIAEYQKDRLNNTFGFVSKKSVSEALWLYKDRLMHNASAADLAVVAAYGIYLLFCLAPAAKKGQFWKAFGKTMPKIAFLLLIRSVLWLYLYMVDRLLDRVTMPLIMGELACIIGFWLRDMHRFAGVHEDMPEKEKPKVTAVTVYLFVVFLLTAAFGKNFMRVSSEYEARERADNRWYALMDYCRENEERYYVIDVYSSTSYEGAAYSEKIFRDADNAYKNFDYCGGWFAKSPLSRQKLADRGFRDLQSALLKQTKVCFVAAPNRDMDWMETYYAKRGVNIACERVDEIRTDSGETAFFVYGLKKQ